jgi:hypothetical protein
VAGDEVGLHAVGPPAQLRLDLRAAEVLDHHADLVVGADLVAELPALLDLGLAALAALDRDLLDPARGLDDVVGVLRRVEVLLDDAEDRAVVVLTRRVGAR